MFGHSRSSAWCSRIRFAPTFTTALVAGLVGLAAVAAPASATIQNYSGATFPFTKGSSSTWWFTFNNPNSRDYSVCFQLWDNGQQQYSHDTKCYDEGSTLSGTVRWPVTGLQSGHAYSVGANEYYDQCNCGIYADGSGFASYQIRL